VLLHWENGVGNTATVSVSPTVNTRYTVKITDANGCVAYETVSVIAESCGEICNNGLDDDGDGKIDCDDIECGPDAPDGIIRN